ncbi:MAG: hypothetical protein U0694_11520 [Anaerolineae bacterium]
MIDRIRNYLIDSYNGLYKIVLQPYMPKRNTVFAILAGFFIGLIWAYVVNTTVFFDADPSQLGQSWQDEWVKLLADRYAAANFQVDDNLRSMLSAVDDPVGIINRLAAENPNDAAKFNQLLQFANEVQATAATPPDTGNIFGGFIMPWIIAPIVVVVLFVIVTLVWGLLIGPNIVGPLIGFIKRGGKPDAGKEELKRIRDERAATEVAKAEAAKRMASDTRGAPVFQKISKYAPGRSFDESFAIETADDVFLGECGASISETVGDGKVAAIEVWIFDKEDFTKTLTQVFVATAGFSDPAMRARLETRGDLVEAKPGAIANFETQTLLMEVRMSEVAYAAGGGLAPNSAFDKITFEFAVWTKSGQGVAKAAGAVMGQASFAPPPVQPLPVPPASPAPSYAPPPTAAPSYAPPPSIESTRPVSSPLGGGAPGLTPLKPPPLQTPPPAAPPSSAPRPAPQDDDLFGGTGDFTPVN